MSPRGSDCDDKYCGGSLPEQQMSETPRYVGPLGRHAHTLAFGSADLTKVILFNNAGPQGPSGG